MEIGTNATAKLEPFLLMAKSARGAAAAKLIQDVTSAPGVFVFAELLESPNIKELEASEQYAPFHSLLQLFAYKTYPDYIQNKEGLPPMNDAQITKLRHLTLVSLAMDHRILPYSHIVSMLHIGSIRELEDLFIDAIYLDILKGKLDQKNEQFHVEYTTGRDVESGRINQLLVSLQNWASTTSAVLATLDEKIIQVAQQATTNKTVKEHYDQQYQSTLKEVLDKQKEIRAASKAATYSGKTGLTEAGKIERDRELERRRKEKERLAKEKEEKEEKEKEEKEEKEKEEKEKEKESMDVDEPADGSNSRNRKAPPQQESDQQQQQRKRNRT